MQISWADHLLSSGDKSVSAGHCPSLLGRHCSTATISSARLAESPNFRDLARTYPWSSVLRHATPPALRRKSRHYHVTAIPYNETNRQRITKWQMDSIRQRFKMKEGFEIMSTIELTDIMKVALKNQPTFDNMKRADLSNESKSCDYRSFEYLSFVARSIASIGSTWSSRTRTGMMFFLSIRSSWSFFIGYPSSMKLEFK